jgi:hypothetical protein
MEWGGMKENSEGGIFKSNICTFVSTFVNATMYCTQHNNKKKNTEWTKNSLCCKIHGLMSSVTVVFTVSLVLRAKCFVQQVEDLH